MDEFWFEVHTPTNVVAGDGTTPIGMLSPGRKHKATGRDDHWVIVSGPDEAVGYVPVSSVTILPIASPPSPPSFDPPTMPPEQRPLAAPPASSPEPTGTTPVSHQARTNRLAIGSMILGILWIVWIGSIAAVALGHVSLNRIDRSQGTEKGRGFAVIGLVLGYGALAVLVAIVIVSSFTQEEQQSQAAPLLPDRQLSLSGTTGQAVAFAETTDGRSRLFEGDGDVSLTFNTSGGPVTGSFTVTMTATDDEGNISVVTYTGVLEGTYIPRDGRFEGTVALSGDAPAGFEAAIPDITLWDGGVVVSSAGCADSGDVCAFGATRPEVALYWEMPLPQDVIDPAYLAPRE